MSDLLEQLSSPWAIRAIVTSSMVGITCGVLGAFIVLRNMSLIGDALAHAILPGIFIAFILVGYSTIGFFIGSVVAGIATAFGITWIQQYVSTKNDAAIGIVFTSMFAIGVMGISKISQRGVHLDLQDFLFGNVLGISSIDICLTFGVMILVLTCISLFYKYFFITSFQETIAKTMGINIKLVHYFLMFLLSFAVVSALRSVGVILVVSMLITPAATALLLAVRLKNVLIISAIIGFAGANIGLLLAILFDTNPGPAMAVTVTGIYGLTVIFSPKKGLLFNYFRKIKTRNTIEQEDILKHSLKQGPQWNLDITKVATVLGLSPQKIKKHVNRLASKQLVQSHNNGYVLSEAGIQQANKLVRAHRLWESYLVEKIGMDESEIHEEAERLEHHLSNTLIDEVDQSLGYPEKDPHGSPIPKSEAILLIKAAKNQKYSFLKEQENDSIDAQLWDMQILPEIPFSVQRKSGQSVDIIYNNKRIRIPLSLAEKALVR
jgi:ABC-type Mn2+/Zn2+ transport system permease subunit/Mn-dependent DtxR family transcriptional regulator